MFLTLLLILALPIGFVLSLGAGMLTFYTAASFVDHLWHLTTISAIVLLLAGGGFAWMAGKRLMHRFGIHFSVIYASAVLALAIVLVVKVLPRPEIPYRAPEPLPGMSYWNLPTGSDIAYVLVPAIGSSRETPIIFLHGGPGFVILENGSAFAAGKLQYGLTMAGSLAAVKVKLVSARVGIHDKVIPPGV